MLRLTIWANNIFTLVLVFIVWAALLVTIDRNGTSWGMFADVMSSVIVASMISASLLRDRWVTYAG